MIKTASRTSTTQAAAAKSSPKPITKTKPPASRPARTPRPTTSQSSTPARHATATRQRTTPRRQMSTTMASAAPTIRTVPSVDESWQTETAAAETVETPLSAATTTTTSATATTSATTPAATPALGSDMATFSPSSSLNGGRPRGPSLDPASAARTDDAASTEATSPGGWDSTIGKAGLGKTGRVINKLVDENETLKREIKLERLRAEEARQAAKLVEDKMERSVAEYESRLLEANVARTLLARKERQLEELTANVDRQRQRADAAADRERGWRDELEKVRTQATQQIEEANTRAELMEGRYNVLSTQWSTHDATIQKLRDEIQAVRDERTRDDERIATLHDLCDQQDSNIRNLAREKERIGDQFEAYKRAQEDGLRNIKEKALLQEEAQERLLEETREALHKLKWALQVNQSSRDDVVQ